MTEPVIETTADEALTDFTDELSDEVLDAAEGEGRACWCIGWCGGGRKPQ